MTEAEVHAPLELEERSSRETEDLTNRRRYRRTHTVSAP